MLRKFIAGLLLAACVPAWAALEGNELSRKLVQEGHVLKMQGQMREAFEKYREAAKADPGASVPLSSMASLLLDLASNAAGADKEKFRENASAAANAALRQAPQDPVAQEVLRKLDDEKDEPLHVPLPAAAKEQALAEVAFARQDWQVALQHYEAAMAADPHYSGAWVGAGDCHFAQQQWPRAAELFRQATVIEPRNSQAWRFLSDALGQQGKLDEAEDALLAAIAAHPSQRPNWDKLAALRQHRGSAPLVSLGLVPKTRLSEQNGKPHIDIDQALAQDKDSPDLAVWLTQGMAFHNRRLVQPSLTPFQLELHSWTQALRAADEIAANNGKTVQDPALVRLQEFYHRNQLDAALLLLRYREAYRPDLDAWLASHPHALREFVVNWNMRP
ncbi:tetratricopeptide repeat protein [Pseudoduganella flava]|nr:tetratricopeptide repeat protein [Pseudoduganella flava]TWI48288.1 tetratricopeptide repeat protein [Pseudoduganella flava]